MIWVGGRMVGGGDLLRSPQVGRELRTSIYMFRQSHLNFLLNRTLYLARWPFGDVPEQNDPCDYPDYLLAPLCCNSRTPAPRCHRSNNLCNLFVPSFSSLNYV